MEKMIKWLYVSSDLHFKGLYMNKAEMRFET